MRQRALGLFLVLGLATTGASQPPIGDPDVRRGIALVEDGEYDSAILTLDEAVRRLAADKGHSIRDLAEAYFYLGVAYLGKGHETSAKARFREAVRQVRDMSPSPEKFPPRVIELFEKAREESRVDALPAATPPAAPAPAAKKKGGSKTLLVIGGVALAGGGAALTLGGPDDDPGVEGLPDNARVTRTESGSVRNGEEQFFRFTASRPGSFEATVAWQDRIVDLTIGCHEFDAPYTPCPGTYARTSDTTGRFTSTVTQREYLVFVSNFSGRAGAEAFTITLRYP